MMTRLEVGAYLEASPEVVAWLVKAGVLELAPDDDAVEEYMGHVLRSLWDKARLRRGRGY